MNKVQEKHILYGLQAAITALNVTAVVLLSWFIYYTTERIRWHNDARAFLDRVKTIPHNPYMVYVMCILLMACLLVSFFVRHSFDDTNRKVVITTLIYDVLITTFTMVLLDFNYNGLLLFVFAETVSYVRERWLKIVLVAIAVFAYLLANYEFLSLWLPLYNLKDYIGYYSSTSQQYYMSFVNLFNSLNVILFFIYCTYMIYSQSNTIEEVNQLYHELQNANEQLKEYANMSEQMAKTKERNRLAREIHDTLGHTLTGITAGLDACITTIDVAPEQTKKQLELLSQVSRGGIKDIRRSVNELSLDALERLHLKMAIQKMIEDMSQVSGAQIYFESGENQLRFDEDEENAIYRVIQESITNALRHGGATKIWITMERTGEELHLQIKDNGIGCKEIKSGFGTKHIQERIEMLRGTVTFDGSNGFTVSAIIPIRWGETYD